MAVDGGSCLDIDLGVHAPGTVLAFDILVADDAVDVLIFDDAGKAPYDLGQSYRSAMTTPVSTESMLGQQVFHWKVPASINAKSWSMVMDNLAHDGDQGQGDQGGARAQISVQVSVLQDGSLTVVHDLYAVLANTSTWLTEDDGLVLDAGTSIQVEAWALDGSADLAFLTDAQRAAWESEGQHAPDSGTALLDVSTSSTLTWTVPPSLDGVPMHLMLDSGDAIIGGAPPDDLRTTVRLTLDPPMNPTVQDDGNGSTTLLQPLLLDASSTPIASTAWWIGCGIWTRTPTRTTTVTRPTTVHGHQRKARPQHGINLELHGHRPRQGRGRPNRHGSASGVRDGRGGANGENLLLGRGTARGRRVPFGPRGRASPFVCPSTDDHRVDVCAWAIDGAPNGQNTTMVASWSDSGEHTVRLTVTDPSGNTDVLERRVVVVDRTAPRLSATSVSACLLRWMRALRRWFA